MSGFQPVHCRSGVTGSVSTRNRSVQVPVSSVIASIGLAPERVARTAPYDQVRGGPRRGEEDRDLQTHAIVLLDPQSAIALQSASVVLPQVQPV